DTFKYLSVSTDTMKLKQISLTLPERLIEESDRFVEEYGYRNIQELILELLRNKVLIEKYSDVEKKMDGKKMTKTEASEYVKGL
ncbi:MAG: ribbon-helix-helix domain-containing protein, partial [Candidatus Woesearchaeota archaeon]